MLPFWLFSVVMVKRKAAPELPMLRAMKKRAVDHDAEGHWAQLRTEPFWGRF